jgi:hypothetical protein
MSVASRVFRGFGNGTVIGTVNERVLRGYTAAPFVPIEYRSRDTRFVFVDANDRLELIGQNDRIMFDMTGDRFMEVLG